MEREGKAAGGRVRVCVVCACVECSEMEEFVPRPTDSYVAFLRNPVLGLA